MDIRKIISCGPSAVFADRLKEDLDKMERRLLELCPGAGELRAGLGRVIGAGGKRLRPLLAWTCWHMAGGEMSIVPLMTMLELMHTTSLIHDDLVDAAETRRGVFTISACEGAAAAVRSGDYLLACAMDDLELYRGTGINEALSRVSQEMCLGELEQHAALFSPRNTDTEQYFRRIKRKTALLMAESCRSGALAGGGAGFAADIFWEYGLHLGMAFQLRDDILDWDECGKSGKAPLKDLQSGVITFPVIYALEKDNCGLRSAVEKVDKSPDDMAFILDRVKGCRALDATYEMMRKECGSAVQSLSLLPECAGKKSLLLLAEKLMEVKHSG